MMYFDYPQVTGADRLARAQPLDASSVQLTPEQGMDNT